MFANPRQNREKKGVVFKSLGRDIEWVFPLVDACFDKIVLSECYERKSCAGNQQLEDNQFSS